MAKDTETSDTGVASSDAYTGLLAISLIALLVGSLLLFLDWSQHSGKPTPPASIPKFEAPKNQPPAVPPGDKKADGNDPKDIKDGKDGAPK
jgi:hypothetical protein